MPLYKIHTKDDAVLVEAESRDFAFAHYFKDVAEQKVPLSKIGNIIILEDNGEEYPFRTVPLLWKMALIEEETAIVTLQSILNVSKNEARKMLQKYGEKDARLIPLIDEIAFKEASAK